MVCLGTSAAYSQTEWLLVPSANEENDWFGHSVSASGNVALVGAKGAEAVFVFRFDGTKWLQEQVLFAPDSQVGDRFGESVAVSRNLAVVGADAAYGNVPYSGSAYVFRFDGERWELEQKLIPLDGNRADSFGSSVAVSDSVVLVGATLDSDLGENAGSAYVFRHERGNWNQEAKLTAIDNGPWQLFGQGVGVDGDLLIVGAPGDDRLGPATGAAYSFQFDGTSWRQQQKLVAEPGNERDVFGYSVAIKGNTALVGSREWWEGIGRNGSAYVFRYDGFSWEQEDRLSASDGVRGDRFGSSVAIDDGIAVVGAPHNDAIADGSGSVYVFRFGGSEWGFQQEIVASEGQAWDNFGLSVALSRDLVVVGTYRGSVTVANSGKAYAYQLDSQQGHSSVRLTDPVGEPLLNKATAIWAVHPNGAETHVADEYTNGDGFLSSYDPTWFGPDDRVKYEVVYKEGSDTSTWGRSDLDVHSDFNGKRWVETLDNAEITSSGTLAYGFPAPGTVTLGHLTVKYRLIVSVEWDATQSYLDTLKQSFSIVSNLLYDATNGQSYIDRVAIYDNAVHWAEADARFYASTEKVPVACRNGFWTADCYEDAHYSIQMPRQFHTKRPPSAWKDDAAALYPYDDWAKPAYPWPAAAIVHEFGHYVLGCHDEYLGDKPWHKPASLSDYRFGIMDEERCLEPICTELSSPEQYTDEVIEKWPKNRGSCWQAYDATLRSTRLVPDIGWLQIPAFLIVGPNQDLELPDHDVGSELISKSPEIRDTSNSAFDKEVRFVNAKGEAVGGASVTLRKSGRVIEQGKTGAEDPYEGHIWILGAHEGDIATASKRFGWLWWYVGRATLSQSSGKELGDVLVVELQAVKPDPANHFVAFDQTSENLLYSVEFSDDRREPSLDDFEVAETVDAGGFSVIDATRTSLPSEGFVDTYHTRFGSAGRAVATVWTRSANQGDYFSDQLLAVYPHTDASQSEFASFRGDAEVVVDTTASFDWLAILSSEFPVLRGSVDTTFAQVGATHSLAFQSPQSVINGRLRIRYDDSDVRATDEATIQVFVWEDHDWRQVGGIVDTSANVVSTDIAGDGLYAVFVTRSSTASEGPGQRGSIDSYRLQNYPNPFRSSTWFRFDLPVASEVRLVVFDVLGREVVTVLDKRLEAGQHVVSWDATDMPSGVYLYRLEAGDVVATRPMVVLK